MDIALSPEFRVAFPEGIFGALAVRGCPNRARAVALQPVQRDVESRLRRRFSDAPIDGDPVAQAYAGYFRRFGTRYPVAHQAKTILSGRPIESPSALVAAMFTAEVDRLILTSGHDLEALAGGLTVDVAQEGDRYTKINGKEQQLKAGDMVVRDGKGVIASVLYGPDFRTRLRAESSAALFGAWCPTGLAARAVAEYLGFLSALLSQEWPEAISDPVQILAVSGSF